MATSMRNSNFSHDLEDVESAEVPELEGAGDFYMFPVYKPHCEF